MKVLNLFKSLSTAMVVLILLIACSPAAYAGFVLIDDFELPDPADAMFVHFIDSNPTLLERQVGGVIGGERDLLARVNGDSWPISFASLIGQDGVTPKGLLQFASWGNPGSSVTLQYDGIDLDDQITPALVNSLGLSDDLTDGGVNDCFVINVNSMDTGNDDIVNFYVRVTGASGGIATLEGSSFDSLTPRDYFLRFNEFNVVGVNPFDEVTSLEFVLNSNSSQNADFEIDYIGTTQIIPEPATIFLFGSALAGFAGLRKSRRRRYRKCNEA